MRKKVLMVILPLVVTSGLLIYGKVESNVKTKEAIKIIALGDSITYGTGDKDQKSYIVRLREKLENEKGIPVTLENFGIPKQRTTHILDQLASAKVNKAIEKADYIFIFIGTNDFRKSAEYEFEQINVQKVKKGKGTYSKNLHDIISSIREKNDSASIVVLGMYNPYTEYENAVQLGELINEWNEEITRVVQANENIYYVPTIDLFTDKRKTELFHDKLHPNAKGYEVIADHVLESIPLFNQNE